MNNLHRIEPASIVSNYQSWQTMLGDRFVLPAFPKKIQKIEIIEYLNSEDPENPGRVNGETHQLMLTPIVPAELQSAKKVEFKWVLVPRWLPPK